MFEGKVLPSLSTINAFYINNLDRSDATLFDEAFESGATYLTDEEIVQLIKGNRTDAIHEPNGIFAFSRIGIGENSNEAILYLGHYLEDLHGVGYLAFLEHLHSGWTVSARHGIWNS